MAELTHLNEASVVHNLQLRYEADLIYVGCPVLLLLPRLIFVADLLRALFGHNKSLLRVTHLRQ